MSTGKELSKSDPKTPVDISHGWAACDTVFDMELSGGFTSRALATAAFCGLLLAGCGAGDQPTTSDPSSPSSSAPTPSPTPTPARSIGLADARAAAYGMFIPTYDTVNTGALSEADSPCGSVTLGNGRGWFTASFERDVSKPDAGPSRATGWAAWALNDIEIATTDEGLREAGLCSGDSEGWAESGTPEPLSAPFAGPGARLTSTKGDRQRIRIYGRVGHLLVFCTAQDLSAGEAQGDTHSGLAGCMDRAGKLADLAQTPDLAATTDNAASMLLASRAQIDGRNTYPYIMGLAKPCVKGPEFVGHDSSSRVSISEKDQADFPTLYVAVDAMPDKAAARAALKAQQDIASECSGDYSLTVGNRSLPMVLDAGVATETGDGGLAFAAAEKNSATTTTYDYSEIFTMGVFKVQVTSIGQATPGEAKRLVDEAVQKVVATS